jgi:hypothetical protein
VLFWFHKTVVHSYMFAPRRSPVRRAHTGHERRDWPRAVRLCTHVAHAAGQVATSWPRATTLRPSLGQPSCLCLKCFIFHTWVQNMLHDVRQWRSLPEVDTWLMSFNMTCFALWMFAMIFCWELDILVWSLDDMHVFGSNMTWIGLYIWSETSFDKTAQIWKFALSHAYISIYQLWQCFDYITIHMCALWLISSLWH